MATRAYKRSFAKTSISAAGTGLCVIVATHLIVPGGFPAVTALVEAVGWVIGALFETVALGGVIAIVAPLGDLFESALKRDMSVKDSGRLLAGHGGMLDRLDALLFASIASYYLIRAFGAA